MNPGSPDGKTWWSTVQNLADLIIRDGLTMDEDTNYIKDELIRAGHKSYDVRMALQWVEDASLSGQIHDVLGMLIPPGNPLRVKHPLEEAAMSPKLWRLLEVFKLKGLVNQDLYERLLESTRKIDSRDWDDEDICEFIGDILEHVAPQLKELDLASLLNGETEYLLN